MSQSLTIEEIASLAQVSRSTVSRVLNEHPNVRASVRERVLQVISEQNYAPRAAARSLANNRTQSLCFLFPNKTSNVFEDPFFAMLMQGMLEVANRRGYFVMLSAVTPDMEQDFYRKVLRSRPLLLPSLPVCMAGGDRCLQPVAPRSCSAPKPLPRRVHSVPILPG